MTEESPLFIDKISLKKIFTGRLDKTNYFLAAILNVCVNIFGAFSDIISPQHGELMYYLMSIALFPLLIGSTIRRLHDFGRSGWWVVLIFVPGVAFILVLYLWLKKGEPIANKYGAVPDPNKNAFHALFGID